jgi:hypothetical protein
MAEPLFFCGLGTQKAGTTWLADCLRRRGDVLVPAVKELHVFDHWFRPVEFGWVPRRFATILAEANKPWVVVEATDRLAMRNLADYRDFFGRRIRPCHRAYGEITPSYAVLPPEGLAMIRDVAPTSRAILLLREPAARLLSEARMQARKRGKPLAEVVQAKLAEPLALSRGRYEEMVPRIEAVFPPDRQLILFTETLFTDAAVARLCDFLGLSFLPGNYRLVVGGAPPEQEAPTAEMIAAARAAYADTYAWARDRFGSALPAAWQG